MGHGAGDQSYEVVTVPHIDPDVRPKIAYTLPPGLSVGELNFVLTDIVDQYIGPAVSYDKINAAIGVLECAKQELYRKVAAPYEDVKETVNGSAYMERE